MFNRGFGGWQGMGVPGSAGEFEQMARQYWNAWEQALRGEIPGTASASVQPGSQAWQDALQCWTEAFAHQPVTNDVMARFGHQARQWYAQIQQVAAQFGGRGGSPAEITQAWKTALGESGVNLFQSLLDSMNGPGMQGMDQWLRAVQPVLNALKGESGTWLNTPAFGFAREHQERLQALAAAQLEVQQATGTYQELLLGASQAAFARFEQRLSAQAAEGQRIETARALFDVWVDAAEQAYAELALSTEYRTAYGNLLNAQIRLRAGIQREVEQFCAQLGIPTRSELDGAHRKIVELERELRRIRDHREPAPAAVSAAQPASAPAKTTAKTPAPRATPAPAPAKKAVRSKLKATPKTAARTTPARQASTAASGKRRKGTPA